MCTQYIYIYLFVSFPNGKMVWIFFSPDSASTDSPIIAETAGSYNGECDVMCSDVSISTFRGVPQEQVVDYVYSTTRLTCTGTSTVLRNTEIFY
jgi:hypothetical protein